MRSTSERWMLAPSMVATTGSSAARAGVSKSTKAPAIAHGATARNLGIQLNPSVAPDASIRMAASSAGRPPA